MKKPRRIKPAPILRAWRWESEFDEKTNDSLGNVQRRTPIGWGAASVSDLAALLNTKHKLTICIRALCMNDAGSWVQSEELRPDKLVKISDFEDMYKQMRTALLDSIQKQHIVDVGWVILTRQIENDDWWQVALGGATLERQELWRFYHNVVKTIPAKSA